MTLKRISNANMNGIIFFRNCFMYLLRFDNLCTNIISKYLIDVKNTV